MYHVGYWASAWWHLPICPPPLPPFAFWWEEEIHLTYESMQSAIPQLKDVQQKSQNCWHLNMECPAIYSEPINPCSQFTPEDDCIHLVSMEIYLCVPNFPGSLTSPRMWAHSQVRAPFSSPTHSKCFTSHNYRYLYMLENLLHFKLKLNEKSRK